MSTDTVTRAPAVPIEDTWRGHRLKHLVSNKATDFAWRWTCARCGDETACWRKPTRWCPGPTPHAAGGDVTGLTTEETL